MSERTPLTKPEKLITLKDASSSLGLPPYKLYRAAKAGIIPVYTLLNARKLVRLSELEAVIAASRQGGSL